MRSNLVQWLRPMAIASLLVVGLAFLGMEAKTFNTGLVQTVEASTGPCSLATLRGNYSLFGQGTITARLPGLPPPPFPTNHSGMVIFDGAGNFSGSEVASVNGMAAPFTFTGTYTVNPDCTASAEITNSAGLVVHESGMITGIGIFQEIHLIVTDPGWVFDETVRKQ